MANIFQVTPFMIVPDIEAALAFMTDILGFTLDFRIADYGYVSREGAGLRILQEGPDNPLQPGTRRFAYYSTATMSTRSMPSSSPGSTRCRRAMCTGRRTSIITSANCWCSPPTAI